MVGLTRTFILIAGLTALFMFIGFAVGGESGAVMAFMVALVMNFFAYYNSDKIVLKMYRAKEASGSEYPRLCKIVEELSNNAGIPNPKFYIINNDQPNAFATGRNPENGAVAVTTGLINRLNEDEIAGVIAHELAHIKNRDTLIMTITATISGAISMVANFAFFFGGHRNDNRGGGIAMILMAILAPFAAMLVQMAISRTREYEADRIGADICKNPLALASALEKISRKAQVIDNQKAENNPATAHMFIINPLHARSVDNLFSTHPNTKNRIKALEEMANNNPEYKKVKKSSNSDFVSPWG